MQGLQVLKWLGQRLNRVYIIHIRGNNVLRYPRYARPHIVFCALRYSTVHKLCLWTSHLTIQAFVFKYTRECYSIT